MKVRRCPMCHRVNEERAWQCNCGYEFGQSPEQALVLLRSQRRNNRIALLVLLIANAAAVGFLVLSIMAGSPVFAGAIFGTLAIQTARVVRKLVITRESMRQLEARTLPKARLLRD